MREREREPGPISLRHPLHSAESLTRFDENHSPRPNDDLYLPPGQRSKPRDGDLMASRNLPSSSSLSLCSLIIFYIMKNDRPAGKAAAAAQPRAASAQSKNNRFLAFARLLIGPPWVLSSLLCVCVCVWDALLGRAHIYTHTHTRNHNKRLV